MQYKVLALDLDGTLFNSKKEQKANANADNGKEEKK